MCQSKIQQDIKMHFWPDSPATSIATNKVKSKM